MDSNSSGTSHLLEQICGRVLESLDVNLKLAFDDIFNELNKKQ